MLAKQPFADVLNMLLVGKGRHILLTQLIRRSDVVGSIFLDLKVLVDVVVILHKVLVFE